MVDQVRQTGANLEGAASVDPVSTRETRANLDVAFDVVELPGEPRQTGANLEVAIRVSDEEVHTCHVYLEAAFSRGPPPGDFVRDTHHYLEAAFKPIYAPIRATPACQGAHAGAAAIQGGGV